MAKRILIYGGSFNPPTVAHEAIMRACLALPGFDELWVMPSCTRADKTITVPEAERVAMLNVVKDATFSNDSRLVISNVEIHLGPPTQQQRTLAELARLYPADEFWFVFGGDAYRDMAHWENAASFMPTIRCVVFTEYDLPAVGDRLMHLHLPADVRQVSSTQVRAALAEGRETEGLLSDAVRRYVLARRLYTSQQ